DKREKLMIKISDGLTHNLLRFQGVLDSSRTISLAIACVKSCIRSELLPEIVINDLSTRTCIFVCAKKLQPSSTLAAKSRFTPMNEHAISSDNATSYTENEPEDAINILGTASKTTTVNRTCEHYWGPGPFRRVRLASLLEEEQSSLVPVSDSVKGESIHDSKDAQKESTNNEPTTIDDINSIKESTILVENKEENQTKTDIEYSEEKISNNSQKTTNELLNTDFTAPEDQSSRVQISNVIDAENIPETTPIKDAQEESSSNVLMRTNDRETTNEVVDELVCSDKPIINGENKDSNQSKKLVASFETSNGSDHTTYQMYLLYIIVDSSQLKKFVNILSRYWRNLVSCYIIKWIVTCGCGPNIQSASVREKNLEPVTWLTGTIEGTNENIDGETILNQVYDEVG
ncbi:hypothetical protein Tco_1043953, partial [Tanacetum coccineum]